MLNIIQTEGFVRIGMAHGKVNAMDLEFCESLEQELQTRADDDSRGVILAGNERVFSAGIDLKRWLAEPGDYVIPFLNRLESLFETVFLFPKPIVAAIAGPAIAGGCMIAAACDARIISSQTVIGIPEMRIGVPLPMTAIEIMRHVAPGDFEKVVLGGMRFAGEEAVAAGLATHCVRPEQVDATADRIVRELSHVPPATYRLTKQQSRGPALRRRNENRQLGEAEFVRIWESTATRTAVQAYVDERLSR